MEESHIGTHRVMGLENAHHLRQIRYSEPQSKIRFNYIFYPYNLVFFFIFFL